MTTIAPSFSSLQRPAGRVGLALLLLALCWAVIASPSQAQSGAVVQVIGPAAPVPAGQPFVVTIAIANAQNLGAFEFEYHYNAAVAGATVNNIQIGSLLGSGGRTTGELRLASAPGQPGVPLYGAYSYGAAAGPNGNGILATVTMTAVAPGVSQLSLAGLKVTDVTGHERAVTTTAGSVTVTAASRQIYLPLLRRSS
ncbi:MAG TPA: cohesin domain-containing protein [Anaerolineae bacterium]|nr:cohesin domain-containing protein [Anaerolineae bacterium]HNU02652.1 cohesin domain-containing protein [Anaerolineae bacterium]